MGSHSSSIDGYPLMDWKRTMIDVEKWWQKSGFNRKNSMEYNAFWIEGPIFGINSNSLLEFVPIWVYAKFVRVCSNFSEFALICPKIRPNSILLEFYFARNVSNLYLSGFTRICSSLSRILFWFSNSSDSNPIQFSVKFSLISRFSDENPSIGVSHISVDIIFHSSKVMWWWQFALKYSFKILIERFSSKPHRNAMKAILYSQM